MVNHQKSPLAQTHHVPSVIVFVLGPYYLFKTIAQQCELHCLDFNKLTK